MKSERPCAIVDALEARLETLTGNDGACCVADWKAGAEKTRAAPSFARALARHKALSDERRLLAVCLIQKHGELCACELQAALGLTHATVSHHMSVLIEAGVIASERRGKWIYYTLTKEQP